MRSLLAKSLLITTVFIAGFCYDALASESLKGFVQIDQDRQLWVDYVAPQEGKPTVVVLNGLTYSTRQWDRFISPLQQMGFGILRYDMWGMGKTLLKYAPINYTITHELQVSDLYYLLQALEVPAPYNLLGLSYGGGIAMAFAEQVPDLVNKLILIAPYTEPLKGQDSWIRTQVQLVRIYYPWNPATDDELYDYFLRQNVYTTYPSAEPIVLENPFKLEATFRLVQGIRKWSAHQAVHQFPAQSVHLMIAGFDQYIPDPVLTDFWNAVPVQAQASLVRVAVSEHKIPEAYPRAAASWVREILLNNEVLSQGRTFDFNPLTGTVRHQEGSFRLEY